MKVGTKVVAVLIPLALVLFVVAALLVGDRETDVRETQFSQQWKVFMRETTELVHELQLERMWTAVFLASDGAIGREQVEVQRGHVQTEVGIFEEGVQAIDRESDTTFNQRLIAAEAELARLSETRTDVDQLNTDQNEAFRRYDEVISSLLSATGVVAETASSPEASLGLVELSDLAQAKESVARVTAVGSVLILSVETGAESAEIGDQLGEANLNQERDFERFAANGRSGSARAENLLEGQSEIDWAAALDAMLGARSAEGVGPIDTDIATWTNLSTARLEGLREIHKELASEISVPS